MLYTLDTNVVSQILNGNQTVLSRLLTILKGDNDVVLNAICYYEAKRGLVLPKFQKKLELFTSLADTYDLLSMDKAAMDIAVEIYQDLRRSGILIEDADLLMGAIAIANNAVLVTHNTKHFERIKDLQLEDWQIYS